MSGSSRKYWTTEELEKDGAYHRSGEAFAKEMVKKIWDRSGYESPKWIGKENAARERARASEAEIASRTPDCPRQVRWTFNNRAPRRQVAA